MMSGCRRRALAVLMPVLLVFLPCGCGGAGGTQSFEEEKASAERLSPLVDDWEYELQQGDLSDFERDVLTRAVETGRIEQDDYEQAHAKFMQCMADRGYGSDKLKFDKGVDGLYYFDSDSDVTFDDTYNNAYNSCSEGTTMLVEALYREQQDNPERYKDRGILAVQCLRDAGVVDDDYTAAQFDTEAESYNSGHGSPQDSFSFPIKSGDLQTLYCLSLGGLSISGNFDDEG